MGMFARLCFLFVYTFAGKIFTCLFRELPIQVFFFTNKRFITIPPVFIKSLIVFRNPNLNTTENATFHKQFKLFTDEAN